MSVVLMSALSSLGCATAGVTILAIAMCMLLRVCRVRSLAIQRFAWLLVLLPGVIVWRASVVLPVLPAEQLSDVGLRSEAEMRRPGSGAGARNLSLRGTNREASFSAVMYSAYKVWAGSALLVVWMGGMFLLAARWSWSYVAFTRALPPPVWPADEWTAEVDDVCDELGVSRPIPLHVTERFGPALCVARGRYRLLVPRAAWKSFSTQQRRSILRHELAHYVRGDLWKSLLARILAWPQWFNPLAWLAVRRFEEAAECACDDAVVAAERENAFDYLRALVELGATEFSSSALQAAVQGGSLQSRVRRLLLPAAKDSIMKKAVFVVAVIALAAIGFTRIRLASARLPATKNESIKNESTKKESAKIEPAKTPGVSLLPNGGFEERQSTSSDPQGWFGTRVPRNFGHFQMGAAQAVAHSGQRSVFVAISNSHPDLKVAYNWTADAKGWQAGETYELSGWIKVENVNDPAFIMAQFWDDEGKNKKMIGGATTQFAYPINGITDWTRVSTRLTVPEGTRVVRIRAGLSSQNNPRATAWFDDISLVKVDH